MAKLETPIRIVPKGWGREEWIENSDLYCGKKLILRAGRRSSLHYHKKKTETFFVQSGRLALEIHYPDGVREIRLMGPGDKCLLEPGTPHRFTGIEDAEIFEFSTQHFDEDSYRLEPGDSQAQGDDY